jgi:hypothetical protein
MTHSVTRPHSPPATHSSTAPFQEWAIVFEQPYNPGVG